MSRVIILYSTDHCSLCEQAMDWLLSAPVVRGAELQVIDVARDDALLARFGDRIPVLQVAEVELDWPFDAAQLERLMS